jgi:uncharacterized 2Fe-2S/4Fe-4S cluster protein (DUF4445 family)|tara:strand:+ start:1075 stop:2751 length:1677 start_codon:yes stop_codon:yes gene_type:complete
MEGTVAGTGPEDERIFTPDEWRDGWRRACRTHPTSNCRLAVPSRSLLARQRTQVEGEETAVALEPAVNVYTLKLPKPEIADFRSDTKRLVETLASEHGVIVKLVDGQVLHKLPTQLRKAEWEVQVIVRDGELIAVGPVGQRTLGLAVDVGTTKLAAYLVDLTNGNTLATTGEMNPQISFGDDVVSRVSRAVQSEHERTELQKVIVDALNRMVRVLCRKVDATTGEISDVVLAGNTAMHHLLLGLPVHQLAVAPYVPVTTEPMDVKCRDIGLNAATGAYAHLLPNIAGFVGGDHTAMLLASEALTCQGTHLFVDIGTNTEVSIVADGTLYSVSCASGPAFEGGHIKDGMRAAPGAIERLWLFNGEPHYETIEGEPPIGICGSGILDTIAVLYRAGVINRSGRMGRDHPRVRKSGSMLEFIIVSEEEKTEPPAIVMSQKDVRELQLAKAAIGAGIEILLRSAGRRVEQLDQIVVAGAFGTFIDLESAITVGLIPPLPVERFRQVGNAAGMGAKQVLLSLTRRAHAQEISARARYVELAAEPDFTQVFTNHIPFFEQEITQ